MKRYRQQNNLLPIEQLAEASWRNSLELSSLIDTNGKEGAATRRQKKHEMLLTFMANAKRQKRRPVPAKPRLLRTLLSFFI